MDELIQEFLVESNENLDQVTTELREGCNEDPDATD